MKAFTLALCASAACAGALSPLPLLFMDKANDALQPWGLQRVVPNAVAVDPAFTAPPSNYSGGAISTAAIVGASGEFEVYVAAGNPGEPLPAAQAAAFVDAMGIAPPGGVSVLRFTTSDFVSWSAPLLSLYLAVGSGGSVGTDVWTVKSIDRDPDSGLCESPLLCRCRP